MEISPKNLKIMLAVALGVIIVLILFMLTPKTDPTSQGQLRRDAKEDSLKKANVNLQFSLTLNKKTIKYLGDREKRWKDTLTRERRGNKAMAAAVTKKHDIPQLTQSQIDSTLSARYKAVVAVTPPDVGSEIVSDLDILDQALNLIPREEQEIEHWQHAVETKDSLNQALVAQDSLRRIETANVASENVMLAQDKDALKKENTKLNRKVNILKVIKNILIGTAVTLGIIAAVK